MPAVVPVIGVDGEPIFYHPHFPQWRSDICKTCKHVIPIRPIKFSKKLTAEQIEEFKECFQVNIAAIRLLPPTTIGITPFGIKDA
jgi:hypothetical protein